MTRLTGKKPNVTIKANTVAQQPSTVAGRPFGLEDQMFPSSVGVRFLYQPGELEGGRLLATDPVWSI